MEDWQSALVVAAIAAVTALVGAVIGRERWPADLRDAKRFGEIVEKMEEGTKERELAAMYRDDLASRWLIGRVVAKNDVRRELGLVFVLAGLAVSVTGLLALVLVLPRLSGSQPEATAAAVGLYAGWAVFGGALFASGVWMGNAYLTRWNRYLTELRAARGMRAPVTDWVKEFDQSYKRPPEGPIAKVTGRRRLLGS